MFEGGPGALYARMDAVTYFRNRKRSTRRLLGLQERGSLPFLGYFGTVGAGLTVVLLFLNVALEPVKPESPRRPSTDIERTVADRRTTTGLAPPALQVVNAAAGSNESGLLPEATAAYVLELSQQQQSTEQAEGPAPSRQIKRTSGKKRTKTPNSDAVWRSYGRARTGYAQENSSVPYTYQGTLGPH